MIFALLHPAIGGTTGFVAGFVHPWSGLDHLAAMVAVGIWAAQLGGQARWYLPITSLLLIAVGGMLGFIGVAWNGVEIGIALSALFLGIMVLAERRPNVAVAAVVVGIVALFHGHAHGTELAPGQSALLYSVGFVIGTGCLHGLGLGIGLTHRWPAGTVALRALGAGIAFIGVNFLMRSIA